MYRYLTAFIVFIGLATFAGQLQAQRLIPISGYLPAGQTKVFPPRTPQNSATDTIFEISGDYHVAGTLIVQEGAEVWFLPNSRIIDTAGGKIIANGCAGLNRRILFRGAGINANSVEWGHFIILPNSDSAYFSNVRFTNFRKRNTVDVTLLYSPTADPTHAAFNAAINNAINGNGGVISTFSQKTFIYNAIVDSSQTSFRGGAFAFLQAPVGWPVPDDGRLALANRQVANLTIRDVRCFNQETTGATDVLALGGAIYMASNSATYNSADYVVGYLGGSNFPCGSPALDVNLFERCTANNTFGNLATNFAKGGAIYVGTNTGLVLTQSTFNNDSAIETVTAPNGGTPDVNSWGGAIDVSAFSGSPTEVPIGSGNSQVPYPPGPSDRLPGLTILKTALFNTCVAGRGGAIALEWNNASIPAPRLNIDAEHFAAPSGGGALVRDSGLIQFVNNVAYLYGGAIYSPNPVFIKGYLAPQNFPWPGGADSVELRVHFANNLAGVGGGGLYLDGNAGGQPDLIERRSVHFHEMVNPFDTRINPAGGVNRGALYGAGVIGGGAEYIGMRDSVFAVEYNSDTVVGGNGGAVEIRDAIAAGNAVPNNRYFVENEYNPQNVRVPRDTFASASIFPFDPRELTRFLNNAVLLGPDSAALFNYNPANTGSAHGRGGALYVEITSDPNQLIEPLDSTFLSHVRMEGNSAYSGSAVWCDRYDFKFMSNLCLIANNHATSPSSANIDLDTAGAGKGISNPGDPNAGATIWADFEGPLPSYESNSRGDAIYDNTARYILRLPVSTIVGRSGVDTLRGDFWGETGPQIITQINPPVGVEQATFFIDFYKGCFTNIYEPNSNPPVQYHPNAIGTVPDTLLMEGRVYDLFDRGTDMKVADYELPRLAPAEAFSLGLPSDVAALHRFTRNFYDTNATYVNKIDLMQTDFVGPHPIGYPLFLQADVALADSNRDPYAKNYTVFMVFNQTTNEFVRVNLKEIKQDEGAGDVQQTYRGRLDFVPDSSVAERHPNLRQRALYTLSLLRPSTMTFDEVQRASMLEDSAALNGREYSLAAADLVAAGDSVFMNCESTGVPANSTWYAGEKYHTLPVRPGDRILVISRTQLWKYGAAYAITHGLQFTIGDVLPPAFVADIPNLQSDTYNPNVRFVHEDVNYNASDAAHTLFRVAGFDANNFYDPRFLFNAANYTQLAFTVTPDLLTGDVVPTGSSYVAKNAADSVRAHVRLNHWLHDSVIYNQNITGSNGYVLLYGQPHNPDVVPGGEGVTATVTNFPPNFASESGLRGSFPGVLGADSLGLSMWVYPPFMNCARIPDSTTAIPDTICIRSTSSTYHFKIVVMDSLPRFLQTSLPKCGAILTDSLRYTVDLNTDDELEDSVAAAETLPGARVADSGSRFPAWDFRYGRTAYDFQTHPSWMLEPQGGNYVPIDSTDPNFKLRGIINVRVDSAYAVNNLLTPIPQVNGELNLDTIAAVEANDGHTGKALQKWAVPILFVPTILNDTLPRAREGVEYSMNFQFPDRINRILIQNLNPSQYFTYKLLYKGDVEYLYRDIPNKVNGDVPPKIGTPDTVVGHTPAWLHIDPYSGVLTGVPGDTDAPHVDGMACGPDSVTVVVTDGQCVATWKTFALDVDSVNHMPMLSRGPAEPCVTNGTQYCDSAYVVDRDLMRDSCGKETLTLSLINMDPSFTVTPSTVSGQLSNDTVHVMICGTFNEPQTFFQNPGPYADTVRLQATDAAGNSDTLVYPVHIGDKPRFECAIYVMNAITQLHPLQDIQKLCFGAGQYGHDSLDVRYCEYEVAPPPPTSAFDARWILPIGGALEGTTVDVRSDVVTSNQFVTWQVKFQPGNESGGAGSLYPIEICWNRSCLNSSALSGVFATGNFYLRNSQNPNEFDINMASGQAQIDNSLYTLTAIGSDSECLQIRDQSVSNALIVFVPAGSGVGEGAPKPEFALQPNYPNPFAGATTLNFSVAEASNVRIDIYDVKGTLVRTLVNEKLDAGSYPVTWDGTDNTGAQVASGTYVAHMTAGSFQASVKMSVQPQGAQ